MVAGKQPHRHHFLHFLVVIRMNIGNSSLLAGFQLRQGQNSEVVALFCLYSTIPLGKIADGCESAESTE